MALSQIPSIDALYAGTGSSIGEASDEAGVGAVQDLLRSHGFTRLPPIHAAGRGKFGPHTRAAVKLFRQSRGLPAADVVDRQMLLELINAPMEMPIVSQVNVTLCLNIDFTNFLKMVTLVAAVEGAGKFGALNRNCNRGGLSLGIIQWSQASGRLNRLLQAFQADAPQILAVLLGGPANVTGILAHTAKPRGGLNANGTTTDAAFDLIRDPWLFRLRSVCRDTTLQKIQVQTARSDFANSFQMIHTQMPKLTMERAVAFALDLANQFGDTGAKSIYDAVESGINDQKPLLIAMRDRSTAKLKTLFPNLPQVARAGTARRNFFISTGLLDDTPLVPDGTTTTTTPAGDLRRFFIAPNTSIGLHPPVTETKARHLIGGKATLEEMAKDIASATAAGSSAFIYMLNWHCDREIQLDSQFPSSQLETLLKTAAENDVQIRSMLWFGARLPKIPLAAALLVDPTAIIAYELIRQVISAAPEHRFNEATVNAIEAMGTAGHDAAAILDQEHKVAGTHHQKVLVINGSDGLIAYVGGVEFNKDRLEVNVSPGSPLFDTAVRLEGRAAWLALQTFRERWNRHPLKHGTDLRGNSFPFPSPTAGGTLTVQMTHTSGRDYPFPLPVNSAATVLANGIRQAQRYFYMEDQYFVGTPELREVMRQALNGNPQLKGVFVLAPREIVLDYGDIPFKRHQFVVPLHDEFQDRFMVFERLGEDQTPTGNNAYVHSKLLLVDDEAAFIGSVNASRRSWYHDSEVDATIVDTNGPGTIAAGGRGWVREFRCNVWDMHFGTAAATTGDFKTDLSVWEGIHSNAVHHASVRPYNYSLEPDRIAGVPDFLLDPFWDYFIDPR